MCQTVKARFWPDMFQAVKARFWPWLSGKTTESLQVVLAADGEEHQTSSLRSASRTCSCVRLYSSTRALSLFICLSPSPPPLCLSLSLSFKSNITYIRIYIYIYTYIYIYKYIYISICRGRAPDEEPSFRVEDLFLREIVCHARALSGSLKFTVRRHKFNQDILSRAWSETGRGQQGSSGAAGGRGGAPDEEPSFRVEYLFLREVVRQHRRLAAVQLLHPARALHQKERERERESLHQGRPLLPTLRNRSRAAQELCLNCV